MNLHGIVRGAITTVNPDIPATLLCSTGYTTDSSGERTPTFDTFTGDIQVQACSGKDIERTNFLNIQGVLRTVYDYGNWTGIVRVDEKGGDILQFPQVPGAAIQTWKVVIVKETWPDWCSFIVQLQDAE